jgi:hypothetical protein
MWWRWLKQRDTWLFFGLTILVRGSLFGLLLREHGLHSAWYGWGAETGDTPGYFEPIDSFLAGHAYRPDFRMPGYGLPYLTFRWITTPQGAGSAIIVLQALLGLVSVVVLARCARLLGAPRWAQVTTCLLYSAIGRVVVHDVYWFTESFCMSAMIFGTHGWLAYQRGGDRSALLWSGFWLAWAVFLRPVQMIWLLLLGTATLWNGSAGAWKKMAAAALLLLPFLLADAWWMRRNLIMHGTFAPLSHGTVMPELAASPMHPLMRFLQATGGNFYHWDPSAHIRWFNMREGPMARQGPRLDRNVEMPRFALCDRITVDSLQAWANDMLRWSDPRTTAEEHNALFHSMNARSDRYVRYYQEDRPWSYHVAARLRHTRLLFTMTGSGALFGSILADPQDRFFPSLFPLDAPMHWIVLIGGLVAAVCYPWLWRIERLTATIALMTLISIFIIPWGLRMCEGRYLVPMYPWLLLLLVLLLTRATASRRAGTGR